MSDTSRVFVIQDDGRKNLSPATNFGAIEVLSTRDLPLFSDPGPVLAQIKAKLANFVPSQDYVLLTGDPLLIGAVCGILIRKHGDIRCLKWDRQNFAYHMIELSV